MSAFGYFGSKQRIAARFQDRLPPHNAWVELFCGSAARTLAKKPAPIEVINDINGDIVNFFRQLQANTSRLTLPNEIPIGLSGEFVSDAGKLSQWQAFVRRSRLDSIEINLEGVVKVIADFILPPSQAAAEEITFALTWVKGGPWDKAMTTVR